MVDEVWTFCGLATPTHASDGARGSDWLGMAGSPLRTGIRWEWPRRSAEVPDVQLRWTTSDSLWWRPRLCELIVKENGSERDPAVLGELLINFAATVLLTRALMPDGQKILPVAEVQTGLLGFLQQLVQVRAAMGLRKEFQPSPPSRPRLRCSSPLIDSPEARGWPLPDRPTSHSSFCSMSRGPTRRITEVSLGKIPTMSDHRPTSGLVDPSKPVGWWPRNGRGRC